MRTKNSEDAQLINPLHAIDGFGANVLGKAIIIGGHVRIEILFGEQRTPMRAIVNRAGAEEQHASESLRVTSQVKKHAAIAVQKVRAGAQLTRGPVRGGVNHDIEMTPFKI